MVSHRPAASRPGPPPRSTPITIHSFFFDGMQHLNGLNFAITRLAATRTYDGVAVAAGVERYDRLVSIAPASPKPTMVLFNDRLDQVMGSGRNSTGTGDIWVVQHTDLTDETFVYVLNTANPSFAGGMFSDQSQYIVTHLLKRSPDAYDVLLGSRPNEAYRPFDAIVCLGSIWLVCGVWARATSNDPWVPSGYGLVRSNDLGATWSRYTDDLALGEEPGRPRGSPWMAQNYYTPGFRQTSGTLLTAVIAAVDYRNNTGVPTPNGCTVDVAGIQRQNSADPWRTDHEVSPSIYINPTLRLTKAHLGGIGLTHAHSCGLLRNGDDLVLIISIGDTQPRNRLIKATLRNFFVQSGIDYTVPGNWMFDLDWHGSYDRNPSDLNDGDGQLGYQPVGMCQHPTDTGALLMGADLEGNGIVKVSVGTDGKAKVEHVYGVQSSLSDGRVLVPSVFIIKTPRPESGPYAAYIANLREDISDALSAKWNRVILSTDGEHWFMAQRGDEDLGAGQPVISGGYVYISKPQTTGMSRVPFPTRVVSARPLLIGAGGRNYVKDGFDFVLTPNSGHTITVITRGANGLFTEPLVSTPIDPQPPTQINQILRIDAVERPQTKTKQIGYYVVDSHNGGPTSFQVGLLQRCSRVWILPAKGLPREKTTELSTDWGAGLPPNFTNQNRSLCTAVQNRWMPHVLSNVFNIPTGYPLRFDLYSTSSPDPMSDVQRYYLAPEFAVDGEGTPGYPLPPDDGLTHPAEFVALSGFSAPHDWTLLVAGMMSDASWDHCFTRTTRLYDLCTFYGDANNYVSFSADAAGLGLKVSVRSGGVDLPPFNVGADWFWTRDSALLLGVSYSGATGKLVVAASLGGGAVNTASAALGTAFTAPLAKLQFSDASATKANEFRWIGGQIDDSTSTSESDLISQLNTLGFLPL